MRRLVMLFAVTCAARSSIAETDARPRGDVLRMARSDDGLRFTSDKDDFDQASSPELVLLPKGELLALSQINPGTKGGGNKLLLRMSRDDGRTWDSKRELRFHEGFPGDGSISNADAVVLADGSIRMYFTIHRPSRDPRRSNVAIRSAISKDLERGKVEPDACLRRMDFPDPRACVVPFNGKTWMFLGDPYASGDADLLRRAVSRDGRRFAPLSAIELDEEFHVSTVLPMEKGLRAYGWNGEGIVSFVSDDGRAWKREDGVRLAGSWDPAVVRLKSGSYVMLYNAGPPPKRTATDEPAMEVPVADRSAIVPGDLVLQDAIEPVELPSGEPISEDEYEALLAASQPDPDGFAPQPNYGEPVDYNRWYLEQAIEPTDDNAYDAYLAFMPQFREEGTPDRGDWPEFNDMFNDEEFDGNPQPWKPGDHPEWEAARKDVREVLEKFRDANARTGYAMRINPLPDASADGADEDRLLVNLMLPHLQPHRTLGKAALADAWRADENGKLSTDRMIDAWKTVLRGAEHMNSGTTIIENLIGIAERSATEQTARWALKHGVFDEKELERGFNALREYDRATPDPSRYIRGEYAMVSDMTQYVFSPPGPDGKPRINLDRVRRMIDLMGDESVDADNFKDLGPEDARATIEASDAYYRALAEQMRIGYPEVRSADLDALLEGFKGTSPVSLALLPGLSRYYALRARGEASRRATQLAYAVHVQHARTGRWPASLDALPAEFGDDIRIDPFSGRSFGYRVTRDGPVIYSVSENGVDDGGVHRERWNDGESYDGGSDDYVFWPPQRR